MKQEDYTGKEVVCTGINFCAESESCGGSRVHQFDKSECGKCPLDRHNIFTCEPYETK